MKLKRIICALLALVLCLPACAMAEVTPNTALPTPKWKDVAVHDPSIIKADDGWYYIYGSHMAAARSQDLIKWELISRDATNGGCTLVEKVQTQMKEALSYAKTSTFWAPDVVQLQDGRYAMYYCTCEGSSPLSMLGIAYADKPEGPYVNGGILLKSGYSGYNANNNPNVVDPCTFYDKEGRLWMVYGSYSGGIFIFEMDPLTGLPLEGQSAYGKKLLGGNHARIEAPYIMYSPDTDYYYMFLSFGGLAANDDYIQQMFAATVGDQVVESSCDSANQLVYHVVTRTEDELYLKLVNVSAADEAMTLSLAGVPDGTAAFTRLTGDKAAVNTFTNVRVAPQQGEIAFQGGAADMILPAYSCTIVTVPLK